MKEIKLFNRNGANLKLVKQKDIDSNISQWKLEIDSEHSYCLKYIRIIGDYPKSIDAIDPPGGPFISIGDEFENKYKIVEIINPTTFLISLNEGNNNN